MIHGKAQMEPTTWSVLLEQRIEPACAVTMTKDETIRLQAAEIERLRTLLRIREHLESAGVDAIEQLAAMERGYKSFRDTSEEEFTRLRAEVALDEQRVADLMDDLNKAGHKIENLRELLREIWEHRNGGSALSSSWDRRVTEVLETNGPT